MKYVKWSQEQIDFLTANYPTRGANFCADALSRKKQNVNQKAYKLGLTFIGLLSAQPDYKICRKCLKDKPLNQFKLIKSKPDTYCADCRTIIWTNDREKHPLRDRAYYLKNAELIKVKQVQRTRERLKVDPYFRMVHNLRSRVRGAIKNNKKSNSTAKLTGCPLPDLRNHIASQFQTGMTWNNYGQWEIDHKRPCASFDLSTPEQQRECFHFTNLQPLWKADNRAKSDSYQTITQ